VQTPSSLKPIGSNECGDFTTHFWTKWPLIHCDAIEDVRHRNVPSSAADFFQIEPCLVSMFQMNMLLWAPLVLVFCLKRLYHVQKYDPNEFPSSRQLEPDCSAESLPEQKKSSMKKTSYFVAISSLPSYMPSLRKATMAHDKQRRQTSEPYHQNNNSFERLLLLLSLFSNAISVMASFSAMFSQERKREGKTLDGNESQDMTNYSFRKHRCARSDSNDTMRQGPFLFTTDWLAYVVALVFTAVLMNDAMYVLEYQQHNLIAFHLFFIYQSLKRFGSKVALATAIPISAIAFCIMAYQDLDLPAIEPGLYYDETNAFISETVQEWPVDKRTYDDGRGTPWMITGDTRTGLPFMVNNVPEQKFVRKWVPLPEENEAIILDIAFPDSKVIDDDKRVYLILHGINGDSNEGYVVDFVRRQVSLGNIVAVMVTRGLGDSPILGENILHFARISDVSAVARALKKAINEVSHGDGLLLAGVGYSMGAITLANYVAQVNPPDIDVAIAFSGSLDTTQQENFQRSASLWQPFVAKAMRDTLLGRYSRQIRQKLDQNQLKEVMKAKSLVDFDRALFVPYNDFESLDDYYSRMGAMADFDTNGYEGRISNVSIPLLCVQSLDDPLSYWKTYHDPKKVSKSGNGNTVLLFTRRGGHVGWPLGWNPSTYGWSWMSDTASSFVESVDRVRRSQSPLL